MIPSEAINIPLKYDDHSEYLKDKKWNKYGLTPFIADFYVDMDEDIKSTDGRGKKTVTTLSKLIKGACKMHPAYIYFRTEDEFLLKLVVKSRYWFKVEEAKKV